MFKIYNSNRKYIDYFSNIKQKFAFCVFFALFFCQIANSTTRDEVYKYIETFKNAALIQQRENGIPACITLAQGLLESAAGTSKLAREGNNHFGIKCHRWKGDSVFSGKTCYRKYRSADDSYLDHSRFLKSKRYAPLYLLDINDYRGWARGLKECGYATDPLYAEKLINLIETYSLDKYITESTNKDDKNNRRTRPLLRHPTKRRHNLNYIMAVIGDTYQDIADEYNMKLSKLLDYNDLPKGSVQPEPGDFVYVNKKHHESQGIHEIYRVKDDGETLWQVSQMFGIQLKSLAKINDLPQSAVLHKGDLIKLKSGL